jgi:NAD(P)-dependent dehydrogenase (short-subunit alcohol dehydrogenase family)
MGPKELIDELLEISIVGSFSRQGYLVRRRLFAWQDPKPDGLVGKTVLVTGATSGLGRAVTDQLAALGARVVLLSRTVEKLEAVRDELTATHGGDCFPIVAADMSSLASVSAAVDQVREAEPGLDVIIDNAGAIHEERTETDAGIEATFATMVVGPFVLISGLLPMLESNGGGRVISVVSGGMYAQQLPLDDLQYARGEFDGTLAYARAKRASSMLIREWARRRRGGGIRFNAMHPGWADTPGLAKSLPRFHDVMGPLLRTPAEGIDTIAWLATDAHAGWPGGDLYLDRRSRLFDRVPATRLSTEQRRRLWDLVVEMSGLDDPAPDVSGQAA